MRLSAVNVLVLGVLLHAGTHLCRADSPPALTNVAAVLALTPERAAAEWPVRVTAAVTYVDPGAGILLVEDDTSGIFVSTRATLPALPVGTIVEVEGRSDYGLHEPTIVQATIKAGGASPIEPARPAAAEVVAGRFNCRFIELGGTVRQVVEHRGRSTLLIEGSDGAVIEANFLHSVRSNLWDAVVHVRGVSMLRGAKNGHALAIVLYCTSQDSITVERPGRPDAFAVEPQTFRTVSALGDSQRVRVDGTVVGIAGNGAVAVEDSSRDRFTIEARGPVPLRTNDHVQVSGVPVRVNGQVTFRYLELRNVAPPLDTNGTPALVPVLTRVASIRQLGARADHGYPVRIRGWVTYYDRGWKLFVQDESGGIYVFPDEKKFPLRAGQWIEVEGFTHSGMYAPVINDPQFTVLGENELPPAKPLTAEVLSRGQHDAQRVEIAGVVSSAVRDGEHVAHIELTTPTGRLMASLWLDDAALPSNLIDAEVRLRGVAGSTFNQRKQFTGARLYVASTNDLIIEQAAPSDLFAGDAQPVASLLKFGSPSLHRAKLSGTVTLADPRASLLCVQDGSGGVFVHVQPWTDVTAGDAVEALGFPTPGSYLPTLAQASVRVVGKGRVIQPALLRTAEAASGAHEAELVCLEAQVLDRFVRATNEVLVLQSGGFTFQALKPHRPQEPSLILLEVRSIVRLTGVCHALGNDASASPDFQLLLRSLDDVQVLRTPSWWEEPRLRTVAGLAGLLALTPVLWATLLRRKVREQTAIIRAQLEREQRTKEELEARVIERTGELSRANQDLQQTRDTLEMRVEERTAALLYANDLLSDEIAVRERSERALRMSEERSQLIGHATNDAVWDFDLENNRLWWGEGFETLFGYRRGDVEPGLESWSHRVHPDDLQRVLNGIHAYLDGGSVSWTDEYRFRCVDGSYRHVFDRGYVIRNAGGEPIRIVGAMMDISALKQAQESLRVSEERFSKAFRGSPVPMSISTLADGRYIDLNDAFAKMLGFTREEMLGRTSVELGIWTGSAQRQGVMQQLCERKTVRDEYVDLRSRNGEARHVLASAETVVINNVECLLAILSDVTERVQLEAQLRQSQKMEAVGQLAAGIAHDFNNLLTVILGHVTLLRDGGGNADQVMAFSEIGDAADRAADLTRQLLTFSRRQPLRPRALDLNEVITGASQMLRRILGERIRLHFKHAAALPAIRADRVMLEQVIMNLSVNARDAMAGGGWLRFTTRVQEIANEYLQRNPEAVSGTFVCMSIADTGCGMDAATVSRIFEPFFTTKEVGKGTGLGLATAYGIVKQHGGWIEVASAPGRGTTFSIYFPALEQPVPDENGARIEGPVRGGKETILVVEDESGVRDLARNVLRRYGYEVLSASDGSEAVQVWEKHRTDIDLLLTDMIMPNGPGGRELANRFRSEQPQLKVIYTSGYSVEIGGADAPLDEGANFLPKPYPAQRLASVVRECLDVEPAQP